MKNQRKQVQKDFQFEITDLETGEILFEKTIKDAEYRNDFRKLHEVYERFVAYILNNRNVRLEVITSDIIVPVGQTLFDNIWSGSCLTPPF